MRNQSLMRGATQRHPAPVASQTRFDANFGALPIARASHGLQAVLRSHTRRAVPESLADQASRSKPCRNRPVEEAHTMKLIQGVRAGIVAVAMLALVGGCDTSETSTADSTGGGTSSAEVSTFDETMGHALEDAGSGGASDAQLDILTRAQESGEVTVEQARTAARATAECLEGLGFNAETTEETTPSGLVVPGYRVQTDQGPGGASEDDPAFGASEQCERQESYWVNQVYQTQPASVEANVDYINDTLAPELRTCLEGEGYDVAEDATGVEMVRQAMNLQVEQGAQLPCFDPREVPDF